MFALVQFLVDKVEAVVPVKNIKNFNPDPTKMDLSRPYEVFWKSPNSERTGYWTAFVLIVEENEELLEQTKERVKCPTPDRLEKLLALTLVNEAENTLYGDEIHRKSKEIQERISASEKEKSTSQLKQKLEENKRKRCQSESSSDEDKIGTSSSEGSSSLIESSDEDNLVFQTELKKVTAEYGKVICKLKLKEKENKLLKRKCDQLQELNMSLQTQLLSMLYKNGLPQTPKVPRLDPSLSSDFPKNMSEDNEGGRSLEQAPPLTPKVPELDCSLSNVSPQNRSEVNEGGNLMELTSSPQRNPNSSLASDLCKSERVEDLNAESISEPIIEESSLIELTSPPQGEPKSSLTSDLCESEGAEDWYAESISEPMSEESNSSSFEPLYLHDNGNIMKWKDEQMELAPGVVIKKDQWSKIVSRKKLTESRLVRNLAELMWGSETLKERSVTGTPCRRFKKLGVKAKKALTPKKVVAVQNGLRYWLKEDRGKKEDEILQLSSSFQVRRMLADKIMDLKRKKKNLSETF